ncbi:hypothetical protein B0T17DRAFT_589194 [Bombardia bombarda]|uniref:ARB-07466-like C-terminal domain-containing protein n=1 Tax=Bombardia bombarda TaxID=252184 RepID=A0AA39X8Q3_9PEZI|nr:hypothetical protein B0T17DRAFT_589194 [Bombardia bombarda]
MRILLVCFTAASTALAAVNEPCYGSANQAGVCITSTACTSSGGGLTISGACPADTADVSCAAASPAPLALVSRVSIDGADTVVAAFPGRIREIFCTRDCDCPGTSDHCCGKATDLMCSDAGGTPTMSGREIAEWVMNNGATLNLKYGGWGSWRSMEDRGDVTQNHWDHVHVSYS